MALLEGLLGSSVLKSLSAAFSTPITISTGAESVAELNPVYLLPILVVVAGCFLIYAFGFTSSVSVPPTLHLLTEEVNEKRTKRNKPPRQQQHTKANGHANGHAVTPAKKAKQQPAKSKSEEPKAKSEPAPKPVQQQQPKSKKKPTREQPDEDLNTGDWVQVTRKEKKDRKVPTEKPAFDKKDSESPKKNNKKAAKAWAATADKVGGDAPAAIVVTKPAEAAPAASPVTAEAKSESRPQHEKKQNKGSAAAPEATVEVAQPEEIVAEDPEQYTAVQSRQPSKKVLNKEQQKKAEKKNRRISESEKQQSSPLITPVDQQPPEEPVPVTKPADKITAEIVASYDTSDKQATAKSKNKKNKNKKPAADVAPAAVATEPPKPAPKANKAKKASPPPAPAPIEKPVPVVTETVNIPTEAPVTAEKKTSEISEVTDESHESEGEFKTVVKKRKARRE